MKKKLSNLGCVYILSNPAMPGLLKIGFTAKGGAEERARELSKNTAVPMPFSLEHDAMVEYPQVVETKVHSKLRNCRVSPDREFFKIGVDAAIEVVNDVVYGTADPVEAAVYAMRDHLRLYSEYPDRFKKTTMDIELFAKVVDEVIAGIKK